MSNNDINNNTTVSLEEGSTSQNLDPKNDVVKEILAKIDSIIETQKTLTKMSQRIEEKTKIKAKELKETRINAMNSKDKGVPKIDEIYANLYNELYKKLDDDGIFDEKKRGEKIEKLDMEIAEEILFQNLIENSNREENKPITEGKEASKTEKDVLIMEIEVKTKEIEKLKNEIDEKKRNLQVLETKLTSEQEIIRENNKSLLGKIKSIFSKKSINLKQRNDLKALIEKAKRSCKTLNKDISKQKQEIAEFEDKKELFEKHLKILNTQLETLKKVDNIFN